MAASALVLDLDGAVWNSHPLFAEVLRVEARANGDEVSRALKGGANIVKLVEQCRLSRSRFSNGLRRFVSPSVLYPDMENVLRTLKTRRIPLGLYTSLPGWIVDPMLDGLRLRGCFRCVVHAGNQVRKPSPEGILRLTREAEIEAGAGVFYAGDQAGDAAAARAAGVSFAWTAYGYGSEKPAGTAVQINSPIELLDL